MNHQYRKLFRHGTISQRKNRSSSNVKKSIISEATVLSWKLDCSETVPDSFVFEVEKKFCWAKVSTLKGVPLGQWQFGESLLLIIYYSRAKTLLWIKSSLSLRWSPWSSPPPPSSPPWSSPWSSSRPQARGRNCKAVQARPPTALNGQ